ncbi:unnamed protein product, partial [Leptidea sinapis]
MITESDAVKSENEGRTINQSQISQHTLVARGVNKSRRSFEVVNGGLIVYLDGEGVERVGMQVLQRGPEGGRGHRLQVVRRGQDNMTTQIPLKSDCDITNAVEIFNKCVKTAAWEATSTVHSDNDYIPTYPQIVVDLFCVSNVTSRFQRKDVIPTYIRVAVGHTQSGHRDS